jgi:hypothetical protein
MLQHVEPEDYLLKTKTGPTFVEYLDISESEQEYKGFERK